MEDNKSQLRIDKIFAAVIIFLLCTSALVTLTMAKKYTRTKEPVQATVKTECK